MSKTILPVDELDAYVRERIDLLLVNGNHNSSKTLHIPSQTDWMEPVCHTELDHGNWLDRPVSIYPPDYHPFCAQCAEQQFGIVVIDG